MTTEPAAARDRQLVQLRAAAPKRADPGRQLALQLGTNDLALFAAANAPTLL